MRKSAKFLLCVLSLGLALALAFACSPDSGNTGNSVSESEEPISFEPTDDKFFDFYYISDDTQPILIYAAITRNMPDGVTLETYPKDIVIPSEHDGKPVIGFSFAAGRTIAAVKRVVFPKTIRKVVYLRASFPNLEKIYVEEGNEWLKIKQNCLIDSDGVLVAAGKNASVPNDGSVAEIGDAAFMYCRDLKEIVIPDSVTKIGEGAFAYTNVEAVKIGKGLSEIGEYPFAAANNLSRITVSEKNSRYYSKNNCIIEKGTKTLVQGCKDSVIPDQGSVATIGSGAFYGVIGIKEWDWDEYIENGFYGIPRPIEREYIDFTIPEGVTCIEKDAFCIAYVDNFYLPKSIAEIKNGAFAMCDIRRAHYSGGIGSWNDLDLSHDIEGCMSCSSPVSYGTEFFINGVEIKEIEYPEGTTAITASFSYLPSLTKVIIPSSVTKIANRAFYKYRSSDIELIIEFKGTKEQWKAIEKGYSIVSGKAIVICVDGETTPYEHTHEYYTESEVFPTCDTEGKRVERCYECSDEKITTTPALGHDYVNGECARCGDVDFTDLKYFTFTLSDNGTYSVAVNKDNKSLLPEKIKIPALYDGQAVTTIAGKGFFYCDNLTDVKIPVGVTSIEDFAFYGCNNLTNVTFEGTMEQWEAVEKGLNLFDESQVTKIKCSDGEIEL